MNFEQAVDQQMAKGKSRGQAIAHVSRERPDLHADYIQRVNAEKPDPPKKLSRFDSLVSQYMATGLSKGKAILQVAYNHPYEHAEYIREVNGGSANLDSRFIEVINHSEPSPIIKTESNPERRAPNMFDKMVEAKVNEAVNKTGKFPVSFEAMARAVQAEHPDAIFITYERWNKPQVSQ